MRKSISLVIKGSYNLDLNIDDGLNVKEILQQLFISQIIKFEFETIHEYVARLLVKEQAISLDTNLNYYKVNDGEIIYIEKRDT